MACNTCCPLDPTRVRIHIMIGATTHLRMSYMSMCRPDVATTSRSDPALMPYTLPGRLTTAVQFWPGGARGSQAFNDWSQLPVSSTPAHQQGDGRRG